MNRESFFVLDKEPGLPDPITQHRVFLPTDAGVDLCRQWSVDTNARVIDFAHLYQDITSGEPSLTAGVFVRDQLSRDSSQKNSDLDNLPEVIFACEGALFRLIHASTRAHEFALESLDPEVATLPPGFEIQIRDDPSHIMYTVFAYFCPLLEGYFPRSMNSRWTDEARSRLRDVMLFNGGMEQRYELLSSLYKIPYS